MQTKAQFTFEKVAHNKENDLHMVVSLTAPKISWQKRRPPICVIPVIDCSQSMSSHSKMEYTKQSVLKLIDHLQPGDFIGLVGFSTAAFVITPPIEITQSKKDELKTKVGELQPMAWTNFSDGMLTGLQLGNKTDLPNGTQVRIIMFTDGAANKGVATTKDEIAALAKKTMQECSISAFGYGADAQQDLLLEVSKAGKGNYAYIKNPEDALSAFGKELGGLLSTYATNVVIELAPHNGHRIADVISDVDVEEDDNKVKIKLGEVLAEESRSLVFAVKLSEQKQALPRDVNIFDIKMSYDIVDEDGKKISKTEELKAKIRFVKEGEEQDKATKAVDEIVAVAQLAKKQIEAEKLADKGDYKAAEVVLRAQATDFDSRGLINYAAVANNVSGSVGSQALYASSAGYRSSMLRSTSRGSGYGVSQMDSKAVVELESLNLALNNSTQSTFSASFAGDSGVTVNSEIPGGGGTVWPADASSDNPVPNGVTVAGSIIVPRADVAEQKKAKRPLKVSKSRSKRW